MTEGQSQTIEQVKLTFPDKVEKGRAISGVVFLAGKPDELGRVEYYCIAKGTPYSKKPIVLEPTNAIPTPGRAYEVMIIQDTRPGTLDKGKLIVRMTGFTNPQSTAAQTEQPTTTRPEQKFESKKHDPYPIDLLVRKSPDGTLKTTVRVLDVVMPFNKESGQKVPAAENFRGFCLDGRTLEVLKTIAGAVALRQPCLLEGPTATSKTSSIEYLAMVSNHEVARLNLNGQTDTSELIGKFVPNDGDLQISFEELVRHPDLLTEQSAAILKRCNTEGRAMTKLEAQKIAKNEGLEIPEWRWHDGIIPHAMKTGQWVIMDEVNLAEPQILERLNSVLEASPSLTLSENGGVVIGPKGESKVHDQFRIFATMNPAEYQGRLPMSPAFKDRWAVQRQVPTPTEEQYREMLHFWATGEQPDIMIKTGISGEEEVILGGEKSAALFPLLKDIPKEIIAALSKFQTDIEKLAGTRGLGKDRREPYVFSRRGLINFFQYLFDLELVHPITGYVYTYQNAPDRMIGEALQTYFLNRVDVKDQDKVLDLLYALKLKKRPAKK